MKIDYHRFYRLAPVKPLWLFYVLLYLGGAGVSVLLSWFTLRMCFSWACESTFWSLVIYVLPSWFVFVCLFSVVYVDIDLPKGRLISNNIIKHVGVKVEIPVQDIREIRLQAKKRFGDNVIILTSDKTYHFSIDDSERFAEILKQAKNDIAIVR